MPSFFQNLFKKEADESASGPPAPADRLTEPTTLLNAMNLASPFATAAGEQFTVRELSILLPQQFVRAESLPGDQAVPLPLDLLRASLQQGRPALRLSQIYLVCPFLFNRQVQPAEDIEVVLPFQKVKRMLENVQSASPFTAVAPPRGTESPFAPASPFMQNGGPASTAGSPFALRPESSPQSQNNEVLSPFAADAAPPQEAPPAHNPFQLAEPAPAPPRPASSPFQLVSPAAEPAPPPPVPGVPVLPMSTPSPFALTGNGDSNGKARTGMVETPPAAGPFPAAAPPGAVPLAPAAVPSGTQPVRPAAASGSTSAPVGPVIRVLLSAMLRDVTADDLGFDPSAVPDHVEVLLSLDTVTPQLATGRVEISVEELRQGVEERFRPAFARVRPGLRFVVPLSEVFRSLPPDAIPSPQAAPHIPISTSPFQTPFTLRADDEVNDGKPALPQFVAPAPPVPANPVTHFPVIPPLTGGAKSATGPVHLPPPAPPAAAALPIPEPPPAPAPPFQLPHAAAPAMPGGPPVKLPGLPPLPKLSGAPARPSPFSRPPGAAPAESAEPALPPAPPVAPVSLPKLASVESHDDLGQPFPAAALQNEPPARAPSAEPFDPSKLFSGRPAAKPAPPGTAAPVSTVPAHKPAAPPVTAAPAAPPIEFNFGETPDFARVTLRAIYDTDQDLTTQEIVDRMAKLPGLRAAVSIIKGNTVASSPESGGEDAAQFTASARKSCEYLSGLAESMGYGGSGTFTLRAGAGVRTFFIEGGNCLAVLHGDTAFSPGVRDKLLLTARTLPGITD